MGRASPVVTFVTTFRSARFLLAVALLWAPWPALPVAAAPSPLSAELQAISGALMGSDSDSGIDAQSVSFPTASVWSATIEALASEGSNFSRAAESVSATFTPYSGTIALSFETEVYNPAILAAHTVISSHDAWSYTFLPDEDAVLVFDYAFTGVGSVFFVSSFESPEPLTGTGSLQIDLFAGEPHTIGLYVHAGPSCFGSCNGYASSGSGTFAWSIVPEPGTALLFAGGLLWLGRRRRVARSRPSR